MEHEQRYGTRQECRYPAHLDVGDGSPLRLCMLVDVSKSGARMLLSGPESVPTEFVLLLSKDGRARRYCNVSWRSDKEVGVVFVPAPSKAYAPPAAGATNEPVTDITMLD